MSVDESVLASFFQLSEHKGPSDIRRRRGLIVSCWCKEDKKLSKTECQAFSFSFFLSFKESLFFSPSMMLISSMFQSLVIPGQSEGHKTCTYSPWHKTEPTGTYEMQEMGPMGRTLAIILLYLSLCLSHFMSFLRKGKEDTWGCDCLAICCIVFTTRLMLVIVHQRCRAWS